MAENRPIFWVNNKHSAKLGKLPEIDGNAPNRYFAYFENDYREQAIFINDYDTKTGIVWMGDAGWERPYKVIDGLVPELLLSEIEETWLQACWNAATGLGAK